MSLFGGMKDKLGFGNKPEWQDDDEDASRPEEDAYGEADEGAAEKDSNSILNFDAYDPEKFENITFDHTKTPRVAPYEGPESSSSSSRSPRSSGSSHSSRSSSHRSAGSSHASSVSAADAPSTGWSQPEDPSFLDGVSSSRAHEPSSHAHDYHDEGSAPQHPISAVSEAYSPLGSDFMRMRGNPAAHLEIIKPTQYSDVEKIANAAKVGKSIVLDLNNTKNELAKRILDFAFGVASALNLNVDKAADRVFVISKGPEMLSSAEREYLKEKGVLK